MTSGDKSGSETAGAAASVVDGEDEMHAAMVEFAESATAMAAVSIRMQIMMLEQTRAMLGDFSDMMAEMTARMETPDGTDRNCG